MVLLGAGGAAAIVDPACYAFSSSEAGPPDQASANRLRPLTSCPTPPALAILPDPLSGPRTDSIEGASGDTGAGEWGRLFSLAPPPSVGGQAGQSGQGDEAPEVGLWCHKALAPSLALSHRLLSGDIEGSLELCSQTGLSVPA